MTAATWAELRKGWSPSWRAAEIEAIATYAAAIEDDLWGTVREVERRFLRPLQEARSLLETIQQEGEAEADLIERMAIQAAAGGWLQVSDILLSGLWSNSEIAHRPRRPAVEGSPWAAQVRGVGVTVPGLAWAMRHRRAAAVVRTQARTLAGGGR